MSEYRLTAERVSTVFNDCLPHEGEEGYTLQSVEGVLRSAAFVPRRVAEHRAEIRQMVEELPEEFRADSEGGGWSFLQGCTDRHGNQWTDLHATVEQLFMLGLATGDVIELAPRGVWRMLPGGMPYYAVKPE